MSWVNTLSLSVWFSLRSPPQLAFTPLPLLCSSHCHACLSHGPAGIFLLLLRGDESHLQNTFIFATALWVRVTTRLVFGHQKATQWWSEPISHVSPYPAFPCHPHAMGTGWEEQPWEPWGLVLPLFPAGIFLTPLPVWESRHSSAENGKLQCKACTSRQPAFTFYLLKRRRVMEAVFVQGQRR